MSEWSITGFSGINNMKDPSRIKQPYAEKSGNFGDCELRRCINFDISDSGVLIQRPVSQDIFTKPFDAKLTQQMAGITYTAIGNRLEFTLPFSQNTDEKRNSIRYKTPIVLIQEVGTGMWVSTTQNIYFHAGINPFKIGGFTQTKEANYPAVIGTGEKVNANKMGLENDGFVAVFTTTKGICYGTQTGQLHNISNGIYSYDSPQSGISMIEENNGMLQYKVKFINQHPDSNNIKEPLTNIDINTL